MIPFDQAVLLSECIIGAIALIVTLRYGFWPLVTAVVFVAMVAWGLVLGLVGGELHDTQAHSSSCLCEPCKEAFTKKQDDELRLVYSAQLRRAFEEEASKLVKKTYLDKYGPVDGTIIRTGGPVPEGMVLVTKNMCGCGVRCGHAQRYGVNYSRSGHGSDCYCVSCKP